MSNDQAVDDDDGILLWLHYSCMSWRNTLIRLLHSSRISSRIFLWSGSEIPLINAFLWVIVIDEGCRTEIFLEKQRRHKINGVINEIGRQSSLINSSRWSRFQKLKLIMYFLSHPLNTHNRFINRLSGWLSLPNSSRWSCCQWVI